MHTFKMPVPGQCKDHRALHRAKMRRMTIEGYITMAVSGIGLLAGAADIWIALTRICH